MPDLFDHDRLAFDAELHTIVAGADTVSARQTMPQRRGTTDLRPSLQARQDTEDAKVNGSTQIVQFLLRALGQNHSCHWFNSIRN